MEQIVSALLDVFDRSMLVLGPVLLVGGSSLVCVVGVLFYSTPFVSLESHSLPTVIIIDVLGAWLWFNVLFNWFMCWKTDPGTPPKEAPRDNVQGRICQKCDSFKPARAHHCHVCQRCILAMDHHCPWMANCIGFYNYRYFVLTLFYLVVGAIFCSVVCVVEFDIGIQALLKQSSAGIPKHVFFVFFLCTCAGTAVALLLFWHIYLILSGQTTIEFYQRRTAPVARRRSFVTRSWFKMPFFQAPLESNDYDLGSTQNWNRVFGEPTFWCSWAMPSFRAPPGNGIQWKTCRSLVDTMV